MSIKKFPDHYAMTSPASVYDEEAMTALELGGRTAAKLNEVIEQTNETTKRVDGALETLPHYVDGKVAERVDHYVEDGTFDEAIDRYAGNLENRLDNLAGAMKEGSTTMDAEVIDTRVGFDGKRYASAGEAVRSQVNDAFLAVNDRFSVKATACGYKSNYNRAAMWEQGWIGDDGVPGNTGSDNAMYIRTCDFIPAYVSRIETTGGVADAIRLRVYVYTKAGAFVRKESHNVTSYAFDHANYRYKVAAMGAVGYNTDGTPNFNGFDTKKTTIGVGSASEILMMADPYENRGTVSMDANRYGYKVDYNARHLWEQGYIFAADGENGVDPTGWDYWLYNRLVGIVPENVECVAVAPGFKGRLFAYTKEDDAFSYAETFTLTSNRLNHQENYYRVDFVSNPAVAGNYNFTNDVWQNVYLLGAGAMKSPYVKDVYFPAVPADYYHATGENVGFNASTSYDDFNATFDEMLDKARVNNFYDPFEVGRSSDGQVIMGYRIRLAESNASVVVNRPKVVVIAGQHGFEKGNVFGLYQFVYDLMNNSENSPALTYIREHVDLVVVPVANPYGFDSNSYKNRNGVNLNRNYDYNWVKGASTTSDQYGGAAAFDQPETQAIRNLIANEKNVVLVIDSHSKGSGAVANNADLNWIACCNRNESGYMRLANVVKSHLSTITNHFWLQYAFTSYGGAVGYFTGFDGTGGGVASLDNWVTYERDTIGVTVEGFNAFPGRALHAFDCQQANAEILGNFILAFCREYARG